MTFKKEGQKHTASNRAITFISKELANEKPMFNGIPRRRKSRKPLRIEMSIWLLTGMRLFINASLAIMLIRLSGDVETNPGPQFEINECRTRGLKVCHLNIRSLLPKIDILRLFINKNPFDVIAVSETWLKPSVTNAEINIANYSIARQDRKDKTGGGTVIYVRNGLPYRSRTDLQNNYSESCWIEITRRNTKSLFISSVYRPPDFEIKNFIEKFNNDISKIQENAEIILLGDFNVDYNRRSTAKSRLQTLARAFSLEQLITSPTRITESSESIIDLIFVNNIHRVVASGVIPLDLSDHSLIFCVIKSGVAKTGGNYRDINYRCFKRYDKVKFNRDLENANWSFLDSISDINTTLSTWCNLFSVIAEKHAPIKSRRVKCINKAPWITPELTKLMRERDFHQKQAHKTNSEYHWVKFRQLRNFINNQIKLAKSKYYRDTINADKYNPSGLWKTLNELTSRNISGQNPSCIISEDEPVSDQKSIATILNDYFTSIGMKLAEKIKSTFRPKAPPRPPCNLPYNFEFEEVDEFSVLRELASLQTNKATGLDQISAKLLKDSASTIVSGLTKIINASLHSQTFPDIWKKGKIIPLYKSNDPTSPLEININIGNKESNVNKTSKDSNAEKATATIANINRYEVFNNSDAESTKQQIPSYIKPTTSQKNHGIAKTPSQNCPRSRATEGPITILGDSMIKMIKPTKLSRSIGEKVNIKTFPGATIDDMNHYMQPTLKKQPKLVVLHVGTNDVQRKEPEEIVTQMESLCQGIVKVSNIAISQIIKRKDPVMNTKIDKINSLLAKLCSKFKWQFIRHANIDISNLIEFLRN